MGVLFCSFQLHHSWNTKWFPSKSGTMPTTIPHNADPSYYPKYICSFYFILANLSTYLALWLPLANIFHSSTFSLAFSPLSLHVRSYFSVSVQLKHHFLFEVVHILPQFELFLSLLNSQIIALYPFLTLFTFTECY